ncbi:MAG: prolyl oligopeptidase family serine peptidase [Gemmatimonadetes bacterium]|jgi:acetyl esterase/lipase|nr:prolyl oligopeptidase family serine peptidase [Gemmatimonadota bacterium]MBT4611629.1 prolyl oligopeptidase family serine peptidase [Gemmatimonadota bacterium]MBT5055209.1 prolyl oligopeptidase family serine peptidase [Gemmatimonadota bacterium]MBT5143092.1 prolyl oligopeptidase family serine peptidase [Gemmatimonadota bacterium]MBT5588357.1 prolyl oligopeptidase family serine peptidase [Gemmatimonadota bacterium]
MTVQTIVYGEVLGAGLLADIATPVGAGPFPVIVGVHGGRWHYSDRKQLGIAIDVEHWAKLGFFAMSIDYRLVTCSPAPACYQDTLCAIRWVQAHAQEYGLDPDRVFITGMSAGGHLVSLAATLGEESYMKSGGWEDQPCDFRAAISVSGAYDLLKLDWGCGWITPGVPWDHARLLASPITHVKAEKTKPMLIFHSDNDTSIPINQAVRMAATLTESNVHHRFLHYPDRGHIKLTEDFVIQESLKFISEIEQG